jgi:hypothetical protein
VHLASCSSTNNNDKHCILLFADKLVLTVLEYLLILLPTTGKCRVSSSAALRFIFEDTLMSGFLTLNLHRDRYDYGAGK